MIAVTFGKVLLGIGEDKQSSLNFAQKAYPITMGVIKNRLVDDLKFHSITRYGQENFIKDIEPNNIKRYRYVLTDEMKVKIFLKNSEFQKVLV